MRLVNRNHTHNETAAHAVLVERTKVGRELQEILATIDGIRNQVMRLIPKYPTDNVVYNLISSSPGHPPIFKPEVVQLISSPPPRTSHAQARDATSLMEALAVNPSIMALAAAPNFNQEDADQYEEDLIAFHGHCDIADKALAEASAVLAQELESSDDDE
ncbi:hypothetical protein M422DRAFT_272389 [Sphaerobolus stellatus SS14]|uniref:Uncharacterized protein n=1 Tax=Sphaerobolus stellatus (strain SS14) TaxID=990650 RepID=A0A0C9TBM2_SPHS4|nr:hypothetical protein M422DRAFT_272389 [Sphaerobolus stellatus SS14]